MTVRDLLQLESLRPQLDLVAGAAGLIRPVETITVMEAPDFAEWITGGEFVLTTFYAMRDDPQGQVAVLRALNQRGAAALGIKVHRYVDDLSPALKAEADRCGLPLFAVPRETRFREVIRSVSMALLLQQSAAVTDTDAFQERLLADILTGADLSDTVRAVAEELGAACVVLDARGDLLASSEGDRHLAQELAEGAFRALSGGQWQSGGRIHPARLKDGVLGYVGFAPAEAWDGRKATVARRSVQTLSIQLKARVEGTAHDHQRRLSFMEDLLLKPGIPNEVVVEERAELLGWSVRDVHRVVLIQLAADERRELMANRAGGLLAERFDGGLISVRQGEVLGLISLGEGDPLLKPGKLTQELAAIAKSLATLFHLHPGVLCLGVSGPCRTLGELPNAYRQLKALLNLQRALPQEEGPVDATERLAELTLFHTVTTPEGQLLRERYLEPLIAYDAVHGTQLYETLRTVVTAGSVDTAAAQLYVHPNSLRYRLQRIRELTGASPLGRQGWYLFYTALVLDAFLKSRTP